MSDWQYAQAEPTDRLARLEYFSVEKQAADGSTVEFVISVREYVTPADPMMKFFATADKQTNQKTAGYTPCGWGKTMLHALSECIRAIHKFPYEP